MQAQKRSNGAPFLEVKEEKRKTQAVVENRNKKEENHNIFVDKEEKRIGACG